jgi:hypothetical protein
MKKYFSMVPIINLIMIIMLFIIFCVISIAIIPLVLLWIYGGIAIVSVIVARLENINNIRNLKEVILKIFINFLLTLLVYNIGLMFIFRTADISRVFLTVLILTLESILAYGITLIIKYSKIKNKE